MPYKTNLAYHYLMSSFGLKRWCLYQHIEASGLRDTLRHAILIYMTLNYICKAYLQNVVVCGTL